MNQQTKQCSKCGETKQLVEFFKRRDRKCGYKSDCKLCSKKTSAKSKTPEKIAAWKKSWSHKNQEKVKESKKKDYESHKDSYIKRAGDWAKSNPDIRRAICRRWMEKNEDLIIKYQAKATLSKDTSINRSELPAELVDMKREQLLMHRATKQLIKSLKEKENGTE